METRRQTRAGGASCTTALPDIAPPKKLLAICNDPSQWHCGEASCGSTEALLLGLDTLAVRCSCSDGTPGRGHAAKGDAALWMSFEEPHGLYDGSLTPTSVGTDLLLARTIARLRASLRKLKSLGGTAWERAHGWARVRLAVKLFGTSFLSRKAQLQRMQADIRATAIRKWLHADTARAFRSWQAFASAAAPLPAAEAPAAPSSSKRRRSVPPRADAGTDSAADAAASETRSGANRARDALRGRTGLRNLGNTCYLNSSLQLLGHLLGLRAPLLALRSVVEQRPLATVFRQLSQADGSLDASSCVPTAPDSLPPPQPPRLARLNSGVADLFDDGGGLDGLVLDAEKQPLVAAVHEVLSRLWGDDALAVFSPDAFLKRMWLSMPGFSGYRQHDAEEWFRALLVTLDAELSPPPPPPPPKASRQPVPSAPASTLLSTLVGGEVISRVTCGTCGTVSARAQPFFGPLSVEVPAASRKGRARCRLEDCLDAAFSDEELEGDSAYDCERCGRKRSATISRRLGRLPPVLIIHVLRTDWAAGGRKVTTTVVPPLVPGGDSAGGGPQLLDLSPWVLVDADVPSGAAASSAGRGASRRSGAVSAAAPRASAAPAAPEQLPPPGTRPVYELRSVVEHLGETLRAGHYINYSNVRAEWYQFNDSRVSRASLSDVVSAQAYLFGFERRSDP